MVLAVSINLVSIQRKHFKIWTFCDFFLYVHIQFKLNTNHRCIVLLTRTRMTTQQSWIIEEIARYHILYLSLWWCTAPRVHFRGAPHFRTNGKLTSVRKCNIYLSQLVKSNIKLTKSFWFFFN